jgi:hypothetical protein
VSPELADLIAAREVVERPASVVKELCENAIDAGATKIEVTVNDGGRRLIQVLDNGSGMTAEDARLALRRHATSKLTAAEQLWGIATLGFRGGATATIAQAVYWIARIGGYTGKSSGGPPGALVIARGLRRIEPLVDVLVAEGKRGDQW